MRGLAFLIVSSLALPGRAELLWRADPGPRDPGPWSVLQSAAPSGQPWSPERISSTASPVPGEHQRVIRVTLRSGDVAYNPRHFPSVAMGNRSELIHLPYVHDGDERWYHWRVFFPPDFAVTDGKRGGAVFAQWHHWRPDGEPGSPPLLFVARTDDIRLESVPALGSLDAVTLARVPMKKGRWREFLVHVRFSPAPARATTELWIDGSRVATRPSATLFPGYDAYLKMGLYRRPSAHEDNVVYFDQIAEGTDRASVERPFTAAHSMVVDSPN